MSNWLTRNPLAYGIVMAAAITFGLLIGRAVSGGSLRPDAPMLVTIGLGAVGAFVIGVIRKRRAGTSVDQDPA